jgi:hypothetical protein
MNRLQIYKAVRALGGHLYESSGDRYRVDVTVWTPKGVAWSATGSHTLAVSDFTHAAEAWQDLSNRIEEGTEPCANVDCDVCDEGDDDCGCVLHRT